MNIVQTLDVALPELPERIAQRSYPKLDPRLIAKEHIEHGKTTVLAKLPGSDNFLSLTPEQWELLKLFDGQRSYAEVAEEFSASSGAQFTEADVRDFSSFLMDNADVFYKTSLARNITLSQKLRSGRLKRTRFKLADVADIQIHQWPDADNYLHRLYPYLKWIYTPWCTWVTLALFCLMALMWTAKFGEIWRDSFQFYNFTSKSFRDLVEFWFLFGGMACVHETAHGLTCKHFGGKVEKMGFMLMYFAPTFYCDVTQIWIYGGRFERLWTIISGIWSDLILCVFATFIWWSTATGMLIHDFAYKIMMVTGIGVTIANLNPLIKLDGYYLFAELTGELDLKERSTLYVSSWVRRHIFHMPVEVEYVCPARRPFYIIYAFLSGAYGYVLISLFVLFSYHVFRSYTPAWAFLPAGLVAFLALRSRLRTFGKFLQVLYLDKKERVRNWVNPMKISVVAGSLSVLLFAPLWPDFVNGEYTLEPVQRALIRAQVPGKVIQVFAREGERLPRGSPLLHLQNIDLESRTARAAAELQIASARVVQTQLRYSTYGAALREQERLSVLRRTLQEQTALLPVSAPIDGTLLTPRLQDLQNSYLAAGSVIGEMADLSAMLARVYVPEFSVRDLKLGAAASVLIPSKILPVPGTLVAISAESQPIDFDLVPKEQLSGVRPPKFYVATVRIDNPGYLRPQMSGHAKIFITRRSFASFIFRFTHELFQRRLW